MSLDDALGAARESRRGAVGAHDTIAASLEFTASQLQPSLGRLSRELGVEVDAAGFALGMLAAAFVMQGLDINAAARVAPREFGDFLVACRAMQGREVCAVPSVEHPTVTCGLLPRHGGEHAAGRLRW